MFAPYTDLAEFDWLVSSLNRSQILISGLKDFYLFPKKTLVFGETFLVLGSRHDEAIARRQGNWTW